MQRKVKYTHCLIFLPSVNVNKLTPLCSFFLPVFPENEPIETMTTTPETMTTAAAATPLECPLPFTQYPAGCFYPRLGYVTYQQAVDDCELQGNHSHLSELETQQVFHIECV